jgi:hypothetical protein
MSTNARHRPGLTSMRPEVVAALRCRTKNKKEQLREEPASDLGF